MSNVTHVEFLNCAKCELLLTLVRRGEGDRPTVQYNVKDWSQQCRQLCGGSPLACPWVTPNMRSWLTEIAS
jgi:hypothetical protein